MSEKWQPVVASLDNNCIIVEDADSHETVCGVSLHGCRGHVNEMFRRAHLIAAAPEMLELLKINQSTLRKIIDPNVTVDVDFRGWLKVVDRVIALAEGGEA